MHAMKTKGWMGTVALAALLGATGCSKNEGDGGGGGGSSHASKLEEYAMTPEWINYATVYFGKFGSLNFVEGETSNKKITYPFVVLFPPYALYRIWCKKSEFSQREKYVQTAVCVLILFYFIAFRLNWL